MIFEGLTISDLFDIHTGHVVIASSEEKTLFNSLISTDYPPDILQRVIVSARSVAGILVVTVND